MIETNRVHVGDCRELLPQFAAAGIRARTCVTSPPYWGLRDYGMAGQLGLEPTIGEYVERMVAVFRLVRDCLADDGTLWLNMGDSYYSPRYGGGVGENSTINGTRTQQAYRDAQRARRSQLQQNNQGSLAVVGSPTRRRGHPGLKPKDLVGQPWRLAFALQQPYYAGRIRDERDRIWLAAMLDAEGCIFIHKRKAGQSNGQGYERRNDNYAPGIEISNTHQAVVDQISTLVGQGSICQQGPEQNARRRQTIYRWNLRTVECKELLRELYPHLIAKKQQARIAFGCPSSGERAAAAHQALIGLHRGSPTDVDFAPPPSCFEPGWYLRSDVIWKKPNPMPESAADRPTRTHEYLFLLAKRERYFYNAEAIKEPASPDTNPRYGRSTVSGWEKGALGRGHSVLAHNQPHDGETKFRKLAEPGSGVKNNTSVDEALAVMRDSRNKRSVWTIPTEPFSGAHFATFPRALVAPCVLAGSAVGDLVLDPFMGSGTVGEVAASLGRNFIGCELNPAYVELGNEHRRPTLGLPF